MSTQLEVGDKFYRYGSNGINELLTIDRVTDKRAFAGYRQFKREMKGDSGYLHIIGDSGYSQTWYALATPERDAEFEEKEFRKLLANKNEGYKKWPIEFVRAVLALLPSNP